MSAETVSGTNGHPPSSSEWHAPGPPSSLSAVLAESDPLGDLHAKIDRLTATVERLDRRREELEDLVEDLVPAVNGAIVLARDRLDRLDRSGAWANSTEAVRALETALAGLDPADLHALAAATPELVRAARALAAPEVTGMAPRLVHAMHEAQRGPAPGLWTLFRRARAPRVRRGMGAALALLRGLGEGSGPAGGGARPAPAAAPRRARPAVPTACEAPTARSVAAGPPPVAGSLEVGGRTVALDPDGNLHDPTDWSREVAERFAADAGLALTDEHWRVIDFVREDGADAGAAPGIRRIVAETGVTQKDLYRLFPGGPAVLAARISGLKKPKSCV